MQTGMSTMRLLPTEEFFKAMAAAGMQNIEIALHCKDAEELDYVALRERAKRHGVRLWSYHLPFLGAPMDLASVEESVRQATVASWSELIQKGAEIGIGRFVAHPGRVQPEVDPKLRPFELEQAMRSLRQLARVAAAAGVTIAVEDLPYGCVGRTTKELLQLVSADDRLGICFDTNHFLVEDIYEAAQKIANKIVTIHVSDYDLVSERHWLPGEGKICWQRLYGILVDSGYQGPWMYELPLGSTKNVVRERELTPADLVRNAHQIFNGESPTALGEVIL